MKHGSGLKRLSDNMTDKTKKIIAREGLIFIGFCLVGVVLKYIVFMFKDVPSPTIALAVQNPFAWGLADLSKGLLFKFQIFYANYAYILYVVTRLIIWEVRTSRTNREVGKSGASIGLSMEKKRLSKITILGIIAIIYGACFAALKYFAFYKVISKEFVWQIDIRLITDLAFPVIIIVSAIGILFLKNWARVALLAVSICHLIINGSNLFLLSFFGIVFLPKYIADYRSIFQLLFEGILPLVLPITFLCILFNPKVKEQFK